LLQKISLFKYFVQYLQCTTDVQFKYISEQNLVRLVDRARRANSGVQIMRRLDMATKKNVVNIKEDIPAQIETLRADIALLAETVRDTTKAKASDKVSIVKDVAAEKVDEAKLKYGELSSKAETSIKENPLTSVAIAVGAGMVLGALTRR
jgi:ElaB/YqjD/DUF883 family membrane-anchored ribosome-binding protein